MSIYSVAGHSSSLRDDEPAAFGSSFQGMRFRILISICIAAAVFQLGCSGNQQNGADVNANVQQNGTANPAFANADEALAEGSRLLDAGETERAIEVLNQAVAMNGDLAEGYFRLGIAYSLVEFRDQVAAEESVEPTPTPVPGEKKPKEVKSNSEIAFEKAVAAYKRLIAANREDHLAYYNMGRSYNKLNEDEDAAKALRQAVELKPDDSEYHTELGSILIKLAKYPEAVGALKKAVELDPNNLEAEELLEKAEAGRKRISFTTLPKDDKKSSNSNTNSNSAPDEPATNKKPGPPVVNDKPRSPVANRPKQP